MITRWGGVMFDLISDTLSPDTTKQLTQDSSRTKIGVSRCPARVRPGPRIKQTPKATRRKFMEVRCPGNPRMLVVQEMPGFPSCPCFLLDTAVNTDTSDCVFLSLYEHLTPLTSCIDKPAFTMGRNCVLYRGRSPTPHPSSDSRHFIVKKTVTKEKTSNWGWTRASNTSSVSSVTEPARSASPVRVARYRESEHQRHRHRDRSPHHHRRHQSRHETQHYHSHPRAIDHQQDEHRRHRRHRRRYSEDASPPLPRVTDKEVIHKRCHCEAKPSPTVKSPHICPSPVLVAVPIKPSLIKPSPKMEEVGGFAYEEWCKRRECVAMPTETIATKSSVSNRSTQTQGRTQSEVSDQDNNYRYVAMREPGPQDAVVSFVASEIFCAVH